MQKKPDSKDLGEPVVAPKSEPVAPAIDKYAGQGGSYLKDPVTGKRELVSRTSNRH